jgi:hypothetical protein
MKSHLQVKIWSLAQESKYIRTKEQKWLEKARAARAKEKSATFAEVNYSSLHWHRKGLSSIARHSQLAYGFLRGVPYAVIEQLAYTEPNWEKIQEEAMRFSKDDPRLTTQNFAEWKDAAASYHKATLEARLLELEEQAAYRAANPVERTKRSMEEWQASQNQ